MKIIFNKYDLKGFTLIEMMTVLAVMAILGSIFLNSGYKKNQIRNSLLTDSEDLSITLSDMQNRTTSFVEGLNPPKDLIGYGIFIDTLNPSKIETFYKTINTDLKSNEISSDKEKPVSDLVLTGGNYVKRICLNNNCEIFPEKIAIYFVKPKPHTNFAIPSTDGSYISTISSDQDSSQIDHACIEIISASGEDSRHVDIFYIGQISSSYGPCQNS